MNNLLRNTNWNKDNEFNIFTETNSDQFQENGDSWWGKNEKQFSSWQFSFPTLNPASKVKIKCQQDSRKNSIDEINHNFAKSGNVLNQDNSEKTKEILSVENSCESFTSKI